jgi:hypothetical protein
MAPRGQQTSRPEILLDRFVVFHALLRPDTGTGLRLDRLPAAMSSDTL